MMNEITEKEYENFRNMDSQGLITIKVIQELQRRVEWLEIRLDEKW